MATTLLRPDPTFYPTAKQAAEAPAETLAYLLTLDHTRKTPDAPHAHVERRLEMPDLAWTVALLGAAAITLVT